MLPVKLGLMLLLLGGVPRRGSDGHSVRGELHMLMTGDPGIGVQHGSSR
jgi:DNA replicative helicase MCM subunit Mcm2 (Cdc46/Mcm family)